MPTTEPITVELSPSASGSVVESLLDSAARQLLLVGNWEALAWICAHPLTPESLLLELANVPAPELQGVLGHRPGPPALLEYMAERYGYLEAILTLAIAAYRDNDISPEQFRAFLTKHEQNSAVLESLIYQLKAVNPKNAIVDEVCRRHPDSQRLLGVWERLRTIDRAKTCVSVEEIRVLYRAGDPKVWASLASNLHTPTELLNELVHVTKAPHASHIRHAALQNLKARK